MPTLTPVDLDFAATAPRSVVVEQPIASEPGPIWAALVDNPGWTEWYPKMTSSVSTSDPAHGVGSTRTVEVAGLRADERFVAWEPERLWAFTIVKTNLPLAKSFLEQVELLPGIDHVRVAVQPIPVQVGDLEQVELLPGDGVTNVRYTGSFKPLLLTRPIASLIERQIRTGWTAGLAGLADHVTSS